MSASVAPQHPGLGGGEELVGRHDLVDQAARPRRRRGRASCLRAGRARRPSRRACGRGGWCRRRRGRCRCRISGRPTLALGLSAMKRRWQARPISVPMPAERPGAAQAMGLPPFRVFGSMPARSIFRSRRWIAMMPSKRPRAGSAPASLLHPGEHVEVHAAGEVGLGRGDDDALHGRVGEGGVDGGVELGDALVGQHVHRPAGQVPGDGGDAVGVGVGGEDRHLRPPRGCEPAILQRANAV